MTLLPRRGPSPTAGAPAPGGVAGRADLGGGWRAWLLPADRPVRRYTQLVGGIAVQGVGTALAVHAVLGNMPWDVLHEGVALTTGLLSIGGWMIAVGLVVLLLWLPLRERPGVGTVVNTITAGLWADLFLRVLPAPESVGLAVVLALLGILAHGVGTAIYIGAGLGSGPRDGLMTGLVDRFGGSVRVVRTALEAFVVAVGWVCGGTIGIMTLVYAVTVGWVIHAVLPYVRVSRA
ncbi:YczE/YyaS/YitT family protein [Georgenia faecalis]|uniref:YitT family protein n=1 Tax=Georgenia faecalis TaxID=2483799 RepID=A0ABV9D7Q0_9MICO|nr:hypothetical protein [Georgenia faecalis]